MFFFLRQNRIPDDQGIEKKFPIDKSLSVIDKVFVQVRRCHLFRMAGFSL